MRFTSNIANLLASPYEPFSTINNRHSDVRMPQIRSVFCANSSSPKHTTMELQEHPGFCDDCRNPPKFHQRQYKCANCSGELCETCLKRIWSLQEDENSMSCLNARELQNPPVRRHIIYSTGSDLTKTRRPVSYLYPDYH